MQVNSEVAIEEQGEGHCCSIDSCTASSESDSGAFDEIMTMDGSVPKVTNDGASVAPQTGSCLDASTRFAGSSLSCD